MKGGKNTRSALKILGYGGGDHELDVGDSKAIC